MNAKLESYIRKIRNPHKQAYARAYAEFAQNHSSEVCGENGPSRGSLSVMAAQAVRHNINDILEDSKAALLKKVWDDYGKHGDLSVDTLEQIERIVS